MEAVIFVLTLCGQPDIIVVQEKGKQGIYGYYEDIRRDQQAVDYLMALKDKAVVMVVPDERGICA